MAGHDNLEVLQCNLNRSARAQDLLMQEMAERRVALAVISEPYFVPAQPNWARAADENVAVMVPTSGGFPSVIKTDEGPGFVAVRWGK